MDQTFSKVTERMQRTIDKLGYLVIAWWPGSPRQPCPKPIPGTSIYGISTGAGIFPYPFHVLSETTAQDYENQFKVTGLTAYSEVNTHPVGTTYWRCIAE